MAATGATGRIEAAAAVGIERPFWMTGTTLVARGPDARFTPESVQAERQRPGSILAEPTGK